MLVVSIGVSCFPPLSLVPVGSGSGAVLFLELLAFLLDSSVKCLDVEKIFLSSWIV